jgi:starch synthase (maltosyl-transferring)
VICYSKITQAQDDILVIVVNLDPHTRHDAMIEIPVTEVGLNPWESYQAHDLLTDEKWTWQGERNYVVLNPTQENPRVAHVFAIRRFLRSLPSGEMDFA